MKKIIKNILMLIIIIIGLYVLGILDIYGIYKEGISYFFNK
jgi:hypothetical protein